MLEAIYQNPIVGWFVVFGLLSVYVVIFRVVKAVLRKRDTIFPKILATLKREFTVLLENKRIFKDTHPITHINSLAILLNNHVEYLNEHGVRVYLPKIYGVIWKLYLRSEHSKEFFKTYPRVSHQDAYDYFVSQFIGLTKKDSVLCNNLYLLSEKPVMISNDVYGFCNSLGRLKTAGLSDESLWFKLMRRYQPESLGFIYQHCRFKGIISGLDSSQGPECIINAMLNYSAVKLEDNFDILMTALPPTEWTFHFKRELFDLDVSRVEVTMECYERIPVGSHLHRLTESFIDLFKEERYRTAFSLTQDGTDLHRVKFLMEGSGEPVNFSVKEFEETGVFTNFFKNTSLTINADSQRGLILVLDKEPALEKANG